MKAAWLLFNIFKLIHYAPLQREGILLCTCQSACLSVCPSVTISFPINNSRMPWPTFLKRLTTHPSWAAKESYWFWGHWVKGQGQRGQICQNRFQSITQKCLDLPSSNFVHTSVMGSRGTYLIDFGITGSKVKVTGVKCVKTISDCLSNNFPKWISYIWAT